MSITPFNFLSDNLPRLKAKQLAKTFPYLKLAVSQEATAQALGYSSWYKCLHRNNSASPSPSDQAAGLSVRIERYYHQANVLMALGIAPADADRWVRAWGLTGQPTLAPTVAAPTYYAWDAALRKVDSGELSDDQLVDEFCGEPEFSKYPEIDRPKRVCPGIILGPMGRYPHYAVDHQVNSRIPGYLRGPHSLYHCEDDLDLLASCVPGFAASQSRVEPLRLLSAVQHEWHYGVPHPASKHSVVQALISAAQASPNAMVVISQRAMPKKFGDYDFSRRSVACLRGVDFAEFLREKGKLDPATVIWFDDVAPVRFSMVETLVNCGVGYADLALPVFRDAQRHTPCLPIYSYPFMSGPMSEDEYQGGVERFCLLPLAEDYAGDDDDGGPGDDFEGPDAPLEPNTPANRSFKLQPA